MNTLYDEFTELVDADFPRVDLVGKAANGINRFLIAKSAFSGDEVRRLLAKADARPVAGTTQAGIEAGALAHARPNRDTDPMPQDADAVSALLNYLGDTNTTLEEDPMVQKMISKAAKPTIDATTPDADLRRLAVTGTEAQKQAALVELGTRALLVSAQPVQDPATPTPAAPAQPDPAEVADAVAKAQARAAQKFALAKANAANQDGNPAALALAALSALHTASQVQREIRDASARRR